MKATKKYVAFYHKSLLRLSKETNILDSHQMNKQYKSFQKLTKVNIGAIKIVIIICLIQLRYF